MQTMIDGEVRKAPRGGHLFRAFETAAAMLYGPSLREGLDLTLNELKGGDPPLRRAGSEVERARAAKGRASLYGVWWPAGRFETITEPFRRSSAELCKVIETNPHSCSTRCAPRSCPRATATSPVGDGRPI